MSQHPPAPRVARGFRGLPTSGLGPSRGPWPPRTSQGAEAITACAVRPRPPPPSHALHPTPRRHPVLHPDPAPRQPSRSGPVRTVPSRSVPLRSPASSTASPPGGRSRRGGRWRKAWPSGGRGGGADPPPPASPLRSSPLRSAPPPLTPAPHPAPPGAPPARTAAAAAAAAAGAVRGLPAARSGAALRSPAAPCWGWREGPSRRGSSFGREPGGRTHGDGGEGEAASCRAARGFFLSAGSWKGLTGMWRRRSAHLAEGSRGHASAE